MSLWDLQARVYVYRSKLFPFNTILRKESANISALLAGLQLDGLRILDVGTGTGESLDLLPKQAVVFAVDLSREMVKRARAGRRARFLVAHALSLPFRHGAFDLVTAIGLLEYIGDQAAFLRELSRVTASPGTILLTCAPRTLLNLLRFGLGHRLYLLSDAALRGLLREVGLQMTAFKKSPLQRQLLIQNREANLS
ncbi:MAG: class I SAM-dependent methyltransferase [Calditrichaeota bacterium]|nr:MAG: class I SAM-dependent methyltransferase [Calditrichota bacterium]